jgi:hypothetical protein
MLNATASDDYDHSNSAPAATRSGRCAAAASFFALAGLALGCGASNSQIAKSARRVPVAQLSTLPPAERASALASLPLILEIHKGDTFPVETLLESRLLALHSEGALRVEALETFYVLLNREGAPVVSHDGIAFDDAPGKNSFGVGVSATADKPATVHVSLRWHAPEPEKAP